MAASCGGETVGVPECLTCRLLHRPHVYSSHDDPVLDFCDVLLQILALSRPLCPL